MTTHTTAGRALTYAREMAARQTFYARGRKAAEQGERPRPPADCPDPAAWWAGWTAGRRAR